jgi:hypothetical protein
MARLIRRRERGRRGDEDPHAAWINIARRDEPSRYVTDEPGGTTFAHALEVDPRGTDSVTAEALAEQRAALIDLVIYAYDRTTSSGIRARLADGLARIGVTVMRPDGEPFDPARHEAGGVQPTDDAALHDRIAETERAGFADRGRLIREPVVVVYRRR